jgi:hypothetical protein
MSHNEVLDSLENSRILLVTPGEEYVDTKLFIWDDFLSHNLFQQREKSNVLYAEYGYGITQWQYWLFNQFGSQGGQNASSLIWVRDFDPNFARLLQVTHVWSSKSIDSSLLALVRSGTLLQGYLYEVRPRAESSSSAKLQSIRIHEIDSATTLAVSLAGDSGNPIVVDSLLGKLRPAEEFAFSIEEAVLQFSAFSSAASVVHFPIEFSKCHWLELYAGDESDVKLIPVNGRFLGVYFTGRIAGTIKFKSGGPSGLMCQLRDLLDTREMRSHLLR